MHLNIAEMIQQELNAIPVGKLKEEHYKDPAFASLYPQHFSASPRGKGLIQNYSIYPGIEISFQTLLADSTQHTHKADSKVMEINYCRYGRVGWDVMQNQMVYLGPGDYSIHTKDVCFTSVMSFPSGYYKGLTIHIDLIRLSSNPPELLKDAGITGELLLKKFCLNGITAAFPKDTKMEAIFSGFYDFPTNLREPYFRLKIQELLLWLSGRKETQSSQFTQYQAEQISIVKQIHEFLTDHLEQRITIEDLAKQYLINPTTLKAVFKTVYGNSLAAHIKEHRMEKAAGLLLNSDESISLIARHVGYESQSKFTAAFKDIFQMLPTEYRKFHNH